MLASEKSFWGITSTQFLGAFNDNVFKQVLLLLFVAVPSTSGAPRDMQWLALLVFALPFVLFSGFAGFLSDRGGKRSVIFRCKIAEIVVMLAGTVGFVFYAQHGHGMAVVGVLAAILFCMGAQSAFFGPGKYGILPELFSERDLPAANGIVLMTTFLAIILGSALAGVLKQYQGDRLWVVGVVCIVIAIVGTLTSLLIRRVPPADPTMTFNLDAMVVPHAIRELLRRDRELLKAAIVSCVFWMTAALVQPGVNALGKLQLGQNDARTSLLVTSISAGIAVGSLLAGWLSKNCVNWRLLRCGAAGVVLTLLLLAPTSGAENTHLLGYWGSMAMLVLLGTFTGMFAVPLQVFLQSRPPAALKGRMIATQNLLNWVGIMASSFVYFAMGKLAAWMGWPHSAIFAMTAMLMLPIVLFYRPVEQ